MENPDSILINNIKNGCNDSLKELIDRHSPLCYSICQKFSFPLTQSGFSLTDVFEDRYLIVYKSAQSFNGTSKYSTWLANHMRYHCLNCINKNNNHINMENEELNQFIDKEIPDSANDDKISNIIGIINNINDKKVKKVFELRYSDCKKTPWYKIGKEMGISRQTAINLHEKGKKFICAKLKSEKYE